MEYAGLFAGDDAGREYFYVGHGAVVAVGFGFFDFVNDVHSADYLAEHGVLTVEVGRASLCGVCLALFGVIACGSERCLASGFGYEGVLKRG